MKQKPKLIKKYETLDSQIQETLNLLYPNGFEKHLITFKNHKGEILSALPYEADEYYYMIKMTKAEAFEIAEQEMELPDEEIDEPKRTISLEDLSTEELDAAENELVD